MQNPVETRPQSCGEQLFRVVFRDTILSSGRTYLTGARSQSFWRLYLQGMLYSLKNFTFLTFRLAAGAVNSKIRSPIPLPQRLSGFEGNIKGFFSHG
jgi:hypothetical protein